MKKILIYAYANLNLGDDLFIKILCERYPNTFFYLPAPSEYECLFAKSYKNLKIIPVRNTAIYRYIGYALRKVNICLLPGARIAKKCDGIVYIGGSLFMEKGNWRNQYFIDRHRKIKDLPFYLIGANFGPFQSNDFYRNYRDLFSTYTDICFRDSYSYNLFNDLPNVRLASDVVFQLQPVNKDFHSVEDNQVLISVIDPSKKQLLSKDVEIYYNKIRDVILLLEQHRFKITLMSFCQDEGDEKAIEEIMRLLPDKCSSNVGYYYYRGDIEEALKIIADSSFIMATRFHAMILGWLFKKPVYPIVYNEKMKNVMHDVGFEGSFIEVSNMSNFDPGDVLKSIQNNYVMDLQTQIISSNKQFEKLDEFLELRYKIRM